MLIIKNTGSAKTIKIDGINKTIFKGLNKFEESSVLTNLIRQHPDLILVDEEAPKPVETPKPIEAPVVEKAPDPVEKTQEEDTGTLAGGDAKVPFTLGDLEEPMDDERQRGKRRKRKNN